MTNLFIKQEIERAITKDLSLIIQGQTQKDERYSISLSDLSARLSKHIIPFIIGYAASLAANMTSVDCIKDYFHELNDIQVEEDIKISREEALIIIEHSIDAYQEAEKSINSTMPQTMNKQELMALVCDKIDEMERKEE